MQVHTIDLNFLGEAAAIAVFLIPDDRGYTMVECGPFASHEVLLAKLTDLGIKPNEIHSLLLTHIHFDHAGAAWWWAGQGTKVYVHPRGYRHMVNPERLYNSAARIYGADNMARLWGRMEPIDESVIEEIDDRRELILGGRNWTAHHTPGHASHHIAWATGDVVFTGDVGGVKIHGGPVVPPCPPPDIDVNAWNKSLDRLASLNAGTFYLTHFGAVAPKGHVESLRERLAKYVGFVAEHLEKGTTVENTIPLFTKFVEDELVAAGADINTVAAYRAANPPYMSVAGIARWLEQSAQGS